MMEPHHTDQRLRHGAEHVHDLGARALAELLAEIGREHGIVPDILERLDDYRRLSPAAVRATGGDRFPHYLAAVPR